MIEKNSKIISILLILITFRLGASANYRRKIYKSNSALNIDRNLEEEADSQVKQDEPKEDSQESKIEDSVAQDDEPDTDPERKEYKLSGNIFLL